MSWLQDNWKTLAGFGVIGAIIAYSPDRKTAKAARNPVKTTVRREIPTEKARGHVCVDCGKTLRYGHPTPFGTGTAYRCTGCHYSGILSPMKPRVGIANPERGRVAGAFIGGGVNLPKDWKYCQHCQEWVRHERVTAKGSPKYRKWKCTTPGCPDYLEPWEYQNPKMVSNIPGISANPKGTWPHKEYWCVKCRSIHRLNSKIGKAHATAARRQ